MQTRHLTIPDLHIKADAGDDWIIEGYASTDAVDSYNEVVDPQAFAPYIDRFKEFPVVLLNHEWSSTPVGKVVDAEIRQRGLFVKVLVSKTAPDVWTLIQEGILKAFSIGFRGIRIEMTSDDRPDIWREIELVEISIVNVPANREALFEIAQTRGLDLGPKSYTTKQQRGTGMPEITLDQVKQIAGEEVKSLTPTMIAAADKAAQTAVKTASDSLEVQFKKAGEDLQRSMNEIRDAMKGCVTDAEFKSKIDKVEKDAAAILEQHKRINTPGLETLQERLERAPDYLSKSIYFKSMAEELNVSPAYVQAMTETVDELGRTQAVKDQAKELQMANDTLLILDMLASMHKKHQYRGPQTLKYWQYWSKIQADFRKAMDTATAGEGLEWIPTGFSSQLAELAEGFASVAPKFPRFTMPTSPYKWPIRTTLPTVYLQGESINDSATAIPSSTPGTSNVTFTAFKLAVRCIVSGEFIEDSILAAIPFLRNAIAKAIAFGIDDVIVNGDTTAAHQDSDVTASTDHRKGAIGLRKYALAGTTASSAATTTATTDNIRTIWKLMGECGSDPKALALIMNVREIISLLGDAAVETLEVFGPRATINIGRLEQIYGIPVVYTPKMRVNLNASGVYDGVTVTKSGMILAFTENYMIGDRRMLKLETDRDITTDQDIVVATTRLDFKEMNAYGTGNEGAVFGYNMA